MELRHLRYFRAVAELLHFSRAAERLHLTQPALSRQIRDLEEELGVTLLARHRARTALTPAGERFARRAAEILAAADAAIEEARAAGRRLRIGHYGTLWVEYYSAAWRQFARRHRAFTVEPVELTPVELVAALRREEIDFALLGSLAPELTREFESRRLSTLEMVIALAADNPLAKRRRLALSDLAASEWIAWDEASFPGRERLLRDAARTAGFVPRVTAKVDSVASMFAKIATSRAIGYVLPMSRQLPHSGVVFAKLRAPGIRFDMHAAWPRGSRHAALLQELATTLGEGTR